MKTIKHIGVVGAGTMGAALAQKFAQEGFKVSLADREQKYIDKGLSGIRQMLDEGVKRNVFTEDQLRDILSRISGTVSLADLKRCDLVIEAIFENFDAKAELFRNLSDIVAENCILATNTSSFAVSELAESVSHPERFIGLHYFFHAAKNRLVEIIPGEKTSDETVRAAYRFCILSGKDPIYTKDTYGFAVNRFFVPWLNESVRLLEEGLGSPDEIDLVCMKTFGIGMGPFALMNATGVPVSLHSQRTLEAAFGPSCRVAQRLEEQVNSGQDWQLSPEIQAVESAQEKEISERMLRCVFFVASQILDEKICSPADLDKGARIGLRWKRGPIDLMKYHGETDVRKLVTSYANDHGERIPQSIGDEYWKKECVTLEISGSRAVIRMNCPEDMNALNETVVAQLDAQFRKADANPEVKEIYLTGSGKAFVAGADIRFFVKNMKSRQLEKIVAFTKYGQEVLDRIDHSSKKVIAILNGLTLGGGLELALTADVILALPKAMLAFPETGIGIYPGLGGTQRSARRVGKGLAKYLILTGKMLPAAHAAEVGLIDAVISPEDMFNLLDGGQSLPEIGKKTLPAKWQKLASLYEQNSYQSIIDGKFSEGAIAPEEAGKLSKTMSRKAPIAMAIAEKLIEEARGTASELEQLTTIFNTEDALQGLTHIGQPVEYQGK